jgi:hypothetical protein
MLVLTDAFPGLDVRLVDGVIRDTGVLTAVATATRRAVTKRLLDVSEAWLHESWSASRSGCFN